jgi:pimeloyl-ACP methyl ester carboxylesterase
VNPSDAAPLVLVAGGPGQAASDLYLSMRPVFEPIRRDRDLIIVDQRGTGHSRAGLECPNLDPAALEFQGPEALAGEVEACLTALGQDPRWFTTSVAVRDLETVRQALRLERWHLYGVSYGTRVVRHYMRRHELAVGAVILDGVVPSGRVLGPALAANAERALDEVASQCLRDPACAGAFGDIRASLGAVLAQLEQNPASLTLADPTEGRPREIRLGRREAAGAVRFLSYQAETLALLPLLIDAAGHGHYGPLAAQALLVSQQLGGLLSFPMHNSVVCSEDAPYFAEAGAAIDAAGDPVRGPPESARLAGGGTVPARGEPYLGAALLESLRDICALWPRGPVDPDFRAPLRSARPVLLLSGELDPVTPPADAHEAMAEGLTNALHLIGTGQGHGLAAAGCVPRLMREFLADPVPAALASECLHRLAAPAFFVDFNGPER